MIKKIKYVIKNNENGLYLLPYQENKCWVDIENAQTFTMITGKDKAEDYVDYCWLINESVELKKVEVKIEINEINKIKEKEKIKTKEYILNKEKYLKIKNIVKKNYNNQYNIYVTKLKKMKIIHHIIYNVIRDKDYLNGIELNKRRYFYTHERILLAKDKIYDYTNNLNLINNIFENELSEQELKKIKEKLKKQIE